MRPQLVFADRLEHLAERRIDDAIDQEERGEHDDEHERVHRHFVVESENAEQFSARHVLDAVLAAGELHPQRHQIHHLRQRQRDHGEINALAANGDGAADKTESAALAVPMTTANSGCKPQDFAA